MKVSIINHHAELHLGVSCTVWDFHDTAFATFIPENLVWVKLEIDSLLYSTLICRPYIFLALKLINSILLKFRDCYEPSI
jgi:hypothetical protein